jgi:isopenicillin-N N-acyltransferase-like protein
MTITTTFPIIETQGTPYQCGHQYGQAAKPLIRQNVATYFQLIQYQAGLERDAALEKARRFIHVVEEYNADLLAEMRGVADGAEVSLAEIIMLNARTELLSAVPLHECTAVATVPPATAGTVWLAQNWDWNKATYSSILVLKTQQPDRPAITMLVEAGQIGKMGMNDAGLGLCLNWLQADYQRIGMPVLLLCREILNSAHVDTAINAVYQCQRASAANYLIAYAGEFAVDLETTPDDVDFLEPTDGVLIHTNHFITDRFRWK